MPVRDERGWRWLLRSALLAVTICVASSATPAADRPEVWLAPGLERIARDAAGGMTRSITLHAARGECESFQIAVKPSEVAAPEVGINIGDFAGPSASIPAARAVALFQEHYVHVAKSSPDLRGTNRPLGAGWYADALMPLAAQDVGAGVAFGSLAAGITAGNVVPFWADVCVPRDAAAGRYKSRLAVSLNGRSFELVLDLYVWDFELPRQPSLLSSFLVIKKNPAIERLLLANRLAPLRIDPRDQASAIADWGLRATSVNFWSGADNKHCAMRPPPLVERVRRQARAQDKRLRVYNYTADEIDECPPQHELVKAWGRVLHEAGVANLVTMKPHPDLYDDGSGTGRSAVDIWVLTPLMYDEAGPRVQEVLAKGDEVWSYNAIVADGYAPKWQIDFAPVNFRIQPGFLNQHLGLTGLLYWQVDLWTSDPWNDVATYKGLPGEGMLVYPARQPYSATVAPSMRLKWLRDGADDYDFIALLKSRGCTALADRLTAPVATSWRDWTKDIEVLERQRRLIGEAVERAVHSPGSCEEPS